MVGRLVHKADFERVLATPSRTRSAHFAVHHVASGPAPRKPALREPGTNKLSTADARPCPQPVDDSVAAAPVSGLWLGWVVPKRHARRAVTRSLLKRQIRGAFGRHAAALAAGMWLVRLRAPFAVGEFVSARSAALAAAAHDELDRLLARAAA
jgi:ribonuclease P protein component